MTAVPVPPVSRIKEEEEEEIDDSKLKKNLLQDFATPLVVSRRISRLSEKFEQLPSEYVMKVFLRLRPLTETETSSGENEKCLKISEDRHILTAMAPKDSKVFKASNRGIGDQVQHFTFTKIFDENTNQNDFYQETAHPLVKEFVNGSNGLIFTYGVTNSGKTYTLQGTPGNEGIIPQAITNMFLEIGDKMMEDVPFIPKMGSICNLSENDKNKYKTMKKQLLALADGARYSGNQKTILLDATADLSQSDSCNTTASDNSKLSLNQSDIPVKYAMFVSFVELYCELVYDLLAPISEDRLRSCRSRPVLCISDDKKGTSHVKGMREIQVNSAQEVLKVLHAGQKNLHVAATKLNKDSSRSHCIFTITLVQVMDVPNPHGARISKISFCDLAGSERSSKTGEAGERLKEAGNINNSLMKLGMCIANLRRNQRFKNEAKKQHTVCFRESKLTRLFRNYLLGEGRACMIVNANMCSTGFDETLHVLKFSAVAREVQIINKPRISRATKRPSTTLVDESFVKTKSSRMTIGWENKMPPIKDVDESVENEDDSDADSESDDDSESLEETVYECDVEYWKNREKKYEEIINMLRTELRRTRSEMSDKEKDIRRQCYENTRTQIVQIQQSHEEHIEDTIAILTEEQERKKEIMVGMAMSDMNQLKGRYEDKMWDLTAKTTSLESELKICQEKFDEKSAALDVAENKIIAFEVKINELKMDIDKKTHEFDAAKSQNQRRNRVSGADQDDKEGMLAQIEEGKDLIQSLMVEIDENRKQIEDTQEENDKLQTHLTNLQENTKKVVEDELDRRMKPHKKELKDLKNRLENYEHEISEIEKKSEHNIKTNFDGSQDIVVLDDAKLFKCTDGLIQHLLESKIRQAATNLDEKKPEIADIQTKLTAAHKVIEILQKAIWETRNELVNSKTEISKQQEGFKTTITVHISSLLEKIESLTTENKVVLDKLKTAKHEQITENADLKEEISKLTEDKRKMTENVAELQKAADLVAELEKEKQVLIDNKNCFENELNALNTQFSDVKKQLDDTESKYQQESFDKNTERENLKRFEKEVREKIEILKDLRAEMRGKDEENKDLKTQLGNAQKLLEESRANYNKETKDKLAEIENLKKLENEVQNKKEIMRELRSDIRARERENKEVQSNLDDAERKNIELQKSLDDVTKANDDRDEKIVMLELKIDEMLKERQSVVKKFEKTQLEAKEREIENENLSAKLQKLNEAKTKLAEEFKNSKIEIQTLTKEQKNLSKARNLSDSEKSDLESALELKENDYEKLQTTHHDYRTRMENHIKETTEYHKDELENVKKRHSEELAQLKSDLALCKSKIDTKQEEYASIIDNKDKCIKAFEIQISNEKASNQKLRSELDEQMSEVVKLKSKHAAAMAEISELTKQLETKENLLSPPRKPKTGLDSEVEIKLEPLSESSVRHNSRRTRKMSDAQAPPTSRTRRGTKRGSSILKRGKCSTRPATPLPEETAEDECSETSPIKKSRPAESSIQNDENGVLDDSDLLKTTGNVRGFPQPVLEIDATPTTRSRRRADKKPEEKDDPDFKIWTRKASRRKEKATNSNNSNSNKEDRLASPSFSSVARNFTQVGNMLKNSPVGDALKRIEEVISPANKSPPKKSRRAVETRRGKRKLGPDDISSPFEASPDAVLQDHVPPVSNTPSRMLRSLRSRK